MTLTNYWWLLIWLFTVGVFVYYKIPRKTVVIGNRQEYRWSIEAVLMLALPYVIWAGARESFADTNAYRIMFNEAPTVMSELITYIQAQEKDKGFFILVILIKCIVGNSDTQFFYVIAIFQMCCLMYVFRKHSINLWITFFVFVASTNYLSWMFNGIRQFLAVCICFMATDFVLEKKYFKATILILVATTIHGTAIIMFGAFLIAQGSAWNKKTLFFISILMLVVVYMGNFTNLLSDVLEGTQYSDVMSSDIWLEDDGTNAIRVLVNAIPAIISFIGRKRIQRLENPVVNLCTNMSVIATGIYIVSMFTSGIFVGRLPIYMMLYSYILLPWEIENLFTDNSKKIVYVLMILGYLAFFYYQLHISFSLI